jgi:hypothetical protein
MPEISMSVMISDLLAFEWARGGDKLADAGLAECHSWPRSGLEVLLTTVSDRDGRTPGEGNNFPPSN